MLENWTAADIPEQTRRLAIVTGANGGLGYETALALAGAGAEVIVAARSETKGQDAVRKIRALHPGAKVGCERLDLASLKSVADFAGRIMASHTAVDLLVNNAGVMMPPQRQMTEDGFELQFGTNYLGHFALTARLLPLLRRGRQTRVVNISSLAHRGGGINFDDPQWEKAYRPWPAYCQSKRALLMFGLELQRRSAARGWGLMSNAAHPGFARTDLIANGPGTSGILMRINSVVQPLVSQSAAAGALPILYAATSPVAAASAYYGPRDLFELKGPVASAKIAKQALDKATAALLWELSERLTGVTFDDA